jgi:hypothetical protein
MPDLDALINDIDKRATTVAAPKTGPSQYERESARNYVPQSATGAFLDQLGIEHSTPWSGVSNAGKFYGGMGKSLVVDPLVSAGRMLADPVSGVQGIIDSHKAQFDKAATDINSGHPVKAFGHTLAGSVPLVGPFVGDLADKIGTQDTLSGAGGIAGAMLPMFKGGRGALNEATLPGARRAAAERLASSGAGVDRIGDYGSAPASAIVDNTGLAMSGEGRLNQITAAKNAKLNAVRSLINSPEMTARPSQMFDAINSAADNVRSFITKPAALEELESLRQKAINRSITTSFDGKGTHFPDGVLDMRQWADKGINGKFGADTASISKQFYQSLRGNLKDQLNKIAPEVAPLNNEVHSLIDAEEQATRRFNSDGKKPVVNTSSIPAMVKSLIPGKTLASTTAQKLLSLGTKEAPNVPLHDVPMIMGDRTPNTWINGGDFRNPKLAAPVISSEGSYNLPKISDQELYNIWSNDDLSQEEVNYKFHSLPYPARQRYLELDNTYDSALAHGDTNHPWVINYGIRPDEFPTKYSTSVPTGPVGGNPPTYTTGPTAADIDLAHSQGGVLPVFDNAYFQRSINSLNNNPINSPSNITNPSFIVDTTTPAQESSPMVAGGANTLSSQPYSTYNNPAANSIPAVPERPALKPQKTVRSASPTIAAPTINSAPTADINPNSPYSPMGKSTMAGGYGYGSAPIKPEIAPPPTINSEQSPVLAPNYRPLTADTFPGEKVIVDGFPSTVSSVKKVGNKTVVRYSYKDKGGFLTFDEKEFK